MTAPSIRVRLRWFIVRHLGKLTGQCWASLCIWAAYGDGWNPWRPIDWTCRTDAQRNGECYCAKVKASPRSEAKS